MGAQPHLYHVYWGGGQLPNPNECNSTLMSATRGEMLTPNPNPNECYSTLMSETRGINLTQRNRYPVQKSKFLSNGVFMEYFCQRYTHILCQ